MKMLFVIFLLTLRSPPLTSGYMYKYDTSILDGDSDLGISDGKSYEIEDTDEDASKEIAKPRKTKEFPSINSLKKTSKKFIELINSPTYVDKTHFLELLFENRRRKQMNVITSAKGFGKTTIMDMVKFFAQIEVDPMGTPLKREDMLSYSVFSNESSKLNVSRSIALLNCYLGAYPVIYLNFKNLIGKDIKSTWKNLQSRIKRLFIEYNWMVNRVNQKYKTKRFDCTVNEKLQHSVMQKIINNQKVNAETLEMSLFVFSEALYMHFKRRTLVLIDDFDDPLVELAIHPQKDFPRDRVFKVLGNMLDRLLVGIDKLKYVDVALLAGTTNVRLSVTFNSYGKLFRFNRFLDCHPYASYFAFTEDEVKDLFKRHKLDYKDLEMVKKLHNGYVSVDERYPTPLYCPRSVIVFLNEKINESSLSSSPLIDNPSLTKFFPILKFDKTRSMISELLVSKPIHFAITRKMEYEDLDHVNDVMRHNDNKSALDTNALRTFFTILLDQGYFTNSKKCPDAKTTVFEVANSESLQGLANFFYEYATNYDNVDLNSTMISFDNIFSAKEISEEMLRDLKKALRKLYPTEDNPDTNEYRMHSLIYSALLKNYLNGTVEVKINSDSDIQTETKIRADIFIVDRKHPKAMVIEIRQEITAKEALRLAEKNLKKWRTKRKLNTIKYIGISFNDGGKVRVGYKDNNLHKTPIIIQKVSSKT